MPKAVLINRLGELQNINYTTLTNLKTKFNKKGSGNPSILFKWSNQPRYNIVYFGYREGLENNINRHELPPPIDNILVYGDIIAYIPETDFTSNNYTQFYNDMFQFEDLDDTIIEDELFQQDEDYDFSDGFIVRDDECDEDFITSED